MVITLNQRSGLPELGVVCGSPAAAANISTSSGLGGKSSGFAGLQSSNSSSSAAAAPSGDIIVTCLPRWRTSFAKSSCGVVIDVTITLYETVIAPNHNAGRKQPDL